MEQSLNDNALFELFLLNWIGMKLFFIGLCAMSMTMVRKFSCMQWCEYSCYKSGQSFENMISTSSTEQGAVLSKE